MAGSRENDVIGHRIERIEWLAIDRPVRNHARNIVTRVGATVLGNGVEILEEVHHHALERGHGIVRHQVTEPTHASKLGIGSAEQLLRELEHARFVTLRDPKNVHDDAQRIPDCHVIDEVARATLLGHAIDVDLRKLAQPGLQLPQVLRQEPRLSEHAILHVLGRIHLHE